MKKFALIDQRGNDIFTDIFETEEKALAYAQMNWDHLTKKEQEQRIMFEVVSAETDNDGIIFETAETIKDYKNA